MQRNLVVCFDGTNNEFGATNTNVVRLFQALDQDDESQLAYYDPGVGTIWEPGTLLRASRKVQMILGMAFGLGVTRNVAEAYLFLMEAWHPGDRVCVFGFSRGALEARALAGMIHRCGLLHAHLRSLEPYAMRLYQTPGDYAVVDAFRDTFSRPARVAFLGLWDTVTSMGSVWSPITWPHTATNASVDAVAHAIAIDERRAFFRQNRWRPLVGQRVDEVWFAGVHSDVGGGYPADRGRLWVITLRWMVDRAMQAGLRFNRIRLQQILAEGAGASPGIPDMATSQHDSMTRGWSAFELVPRVRKEARPDGTWGRRVLVPAMQGGFTGRPRTLRPGERVHRSAIERFAMRPDYRPPPLTGAGLTPDIARLFLESPAEEWIVPGGSGARPSPEPARA